MHRTTFARATMVSEAYGMNSNLHFRSKKFTKNVLKLYAWLFLLVGIWIRDKYSERKWHTILGMVLFHIFWTVVTSKVIWTFLVIKITVIDIHTFIILEYLLCLLLWWIMFMKRFHIYNTIECLALSKKQLGLTSKLWIHVLFILINIIYFCLCTLNRVEDHQWLTDKLGTFMTERPLLISVLYTITNLAEFIILHGLPFSVALLYIACCLQTHQLVSHLHTLGKQRQSIDERLFRRSVLVMKELERGLSLAVFVLRSLVEFICTLTAVINFLVGVFHQVFVAFFLQMATLFCLIVFGADSIQNRHSDLKRHLLREIAQKMRQTQEDCLLGKNLAEFLEVKEEDFGLTAWKMFDLDRRVLLSTFASLLTYGVILYQLKQ